MKTKYFKSLMFRNKYFYDVITFKLDVYRYLDYNYDDELLLIEEIL